MASHRLRAGCMLRHASQHDSLVTVGASVTKNADVLIIGKMGANSVNAQGKKWLSLIENQKSNGAKIILDFTDNHLDTHTELTDFYSKIVGLIDQAVCSSRLLQASLGKVFHGKIEVIPDPLEISLQKIKENPFFPRTLLWFGHRTNLPFLAKFLPKLGANFPIRLIVLSDIVGLQSLEQSRPEVPQNLMVEFRVWTIEAMIQAAEESDVCIIPSDPNQPRKSGVSSNRLITALAMGLPTIASLLDSYRPFQEYFTDINSPEYTSPIINPSAFRSQVSNAQTLIAKEYSMESIAEKWYSTIKT